MDHLKFNVNKEGKVYVAYKRQFIKGTHAPRVDASVKKTTINLLHFSKICSVKMRIKCPNIICKL